MNTMRPRTFISRLATAGLLLAFTAAVWAQSPKPRQYDLKIEAQPLAQALQAFSDQSGLQLMFFSDISKGLKSKPLVGSFTREQALRELLQGTILSFDFINDRTVTIRSARQQPAATQDNAALTESAAAQNLQVAQSHSGMQKVDSAQAAAPPGEAENTADDAEILVKGVRIFNVDKPRTVDDAQAYYIFDSKTIERSGATSIQEFLRNRLPMNQVKESQDQQILPSTGGARTPGASNINLRGLPGSRDTLVLVNGRRQPAARSGSSELATPSINNIPLSAIDTIEVLPASAGAIYGAEAVGGVVNVVLKQNYRGAELRAAYNNVVEGDAPVVTYDFLGGLTLEGGKTHLTLTGSYSDSDVMQVGGRPELLEYQSLIRSRNPTYGRMNPLSTTVNIKSLAGGPLTFDDFTPLGSNRTFISPGYAGLPDDKAHLLANAGQFNLALPQTNARNIPAGRYSLLGTPIERQYISASARRQMSTRLELFTEVAHDVSQYEGSVNPVNEAMFLIANNPANPFRQSIFVYVPLYAEALTSAKQTTDRVTAGGLLQLPRAWRLQADVAYAERQSISSAPFTTDTGNGLLTAIRSGAVDVFRDFGVFDASSYARNRVDSDFPAESTDYSVRATGPLWFFSPGGRNISLSASIERRQENYDEGSARTVIQPFSVDATQSAVRVVDRLNPEREQTIDSAYAELTVPLIAPGASKPGLRQLDLQLVGRRDRYHTITSSPSALERTDGGPWEDSVTGLPLDPADVQYSTRRYSSDNYLIGLRWSPIPDIMFRASRGTGFTPPDFYHLVPPSFDGIGDEYIVDDNGTPDDFFDDLLYLVETARGGNPDLEPETSVSTSFGFVLQPRFLEGLRLSVDYTDLEKKDVISELIAQTIYENEQFFPGVIERDGDGIPFRVNTTTVNLNKVLAESYDAHLSYRWRAGGGEFNVFALATWMMHLQRQILPGLPLEELVNVRQGPDDANIQKFRVNGGLDWFNDTWSAGWNFRYYPSYWLPDDPDVELAQASARVDSQAYHDVYTSYRFGGGNGWGDWTDKLELRLGIKNVFNKVPPLDAMRSYYYSTYGSIRLREYTLTVSKGL